MLRKRDVRSEYYLWGIIKPYLPPQKAKTGRPKADLRKAFNGILFVLKTGITWMDIPRIHENKNRR